VRLHTDIAELREDAKDTTRRSLLRAVVAAGGDGTASLVTNQTPPGTPIALLPLGTENLLSKYLEIPADPDRVALLISDGLTTRLDAGQAGDRLFLLMAGCGFDAEVVRRLHQARSGHIHHLSYAKPILDAVRSYRYPPLQVYCGPAAAQEARDNASGNCRPGVPGPDVPGPGVPGPGVPEPGGGEPGGGEPGGRAGSSGVPSSGRLVAEARWVFVVNLPRYACGLSFAPHASGTDGRLDICTFRNGSVWNGMRYLSGVVLGRHTTWRDCQMARAERIRITSEEPVPIQMDGDPAGQLPLDICVAPARLTALVSRSWAARRGGLPAAGA
jgi:diacylglycerol kinase (ATP)